VFALLVIAWCTRTCCAILAWKKDTNVHAGCDRALCFSQQELGVEEFASVDWHCVTGWSALGLGPFYGIPIRKFVESLGPIDAWACLYQVR
jgi:hypothetical protein